MIWVLLQADITTGKLITTWGEVQNSWQFVTNYVCIILHHWSLVWWCEIKIIRSIEDFKYILFLQQTRGIQLGNEEGAFWETNCVPFHCLEIKQLTILIENPAVFLAIVKYCVTMIIMFIIVLFKIPLLEDKHWCPAVKAMPSSLYDEVKSIQKSR